MSKRLKIGLVIGRFQPFHKGHLYLITEALKHVDQLIIFIGSSNIHDLDNPYGYNKRKKIIEQTLLNQGLLPYVVKILPIKDYKSDEEWIEKIIRKCGKIDLVFGQNEWVNKLFEEKGYKVVRVKFYKRNIYSGTIIREKLRKKGKLNA